MPPLRTFIVSSAHMEKYFPITLRKYFKSMLKLHSGAGGGNEAVEESISNDSFDDSEAE
jgi:hypothetical protein